MATARRGSASGIGADWIARIGEARPLHFSSADDAVDLPAHVRAGSGICRWNERLVVVQDDVNALALVDEQAGAVTPLLLPRGPGGRRHFSEPRGNKADKMDLESCLVLPDGRLLALGSGSTAARERIVVVDLEHRVRLVDGGALFEQLRAAQEFAGSELNIEGAVVVRDRLRLFQRGNGAAIGDRDPANAVGDLELGAFLGWLDDGAPAPALASVVRVDLGRVGDVPFGFTDATPLPDGRIVFLAGAEDSPDTYRDGDVLGARIGLLDEDMRLTDIVGAEGKPTPLKLEGVEFVSFTSSGGLELLVVADMDDPDAPAVLAPLRWEPP